MTLAPPGVLAAGRRRTGVLAGGRLASEKGSEKEPFSEPISARPPPRPAAPRRRPPSHPGAIILSAHGVAQRDLDRYYALIGAARPRLPLNQARFLVAAYNGVAIGESDAYLHALRIMPFQVLDALRNPPIDLDPADGSALLDAVRHWTLLQRAAVLDSIERVWARHDQGDIDDLIVALELADGYADASPG